MNAFQVVLRVENYVPLVASIARKYWLALPPEKKAWIGLEDFINEGLIFARYHVMPQYDITQVKFTTYLTVSLKRFYIWKLIGHRREKRTEIFVNFQETLSEDKKYIPRFTVQEESGSRLYSLPTIAVISNIEKEIAGEQGIKKLYDLASPMLKKYVTSWFYSKEGPARVRHGYRFLLAKREFKKLAPSCGLDFSTCKAYLEASRRNNLCL